MNKYHFDIKINDRGNNAGPKAREDCKKILLQNGYKNLEINFIKSKILLPFNLVKLFSIIIYYILVTPPHSFIFVQYPLNGINPFFKYFISILKLKGCKFSCIVHDLESLRTFYNKAKVKEEIEALLAYDAIVSHNNFMSKWLTENGYTKHIEEIILFDYLFENYKEEKIISGFDNQNVTIAFAGNLNKTNFINDLPQTDFYFNINLYGPLKNKPSNYKKIKWQGSYSPDQIVDQIQGDFGLIWDGDSYEDISGSMGNYIKYNTPHKTSLYIAAGLPVIISESAAMAGFILNNNIGICVKDLASIAENTNKINNASYLNMKKNVRLIGEKLKKGWYLNHALFRIENYLYK